MTGFLTKVGEALLSLSFYEYLLVIGLAAFFLILWRLHESKDSKFVFEDFFSNSDGKADVKELAAFGAFLVHSWVIVKKEADGTLEGSTLELYALIWSGAYVLAKGIRAYQSTNGGAAKEGEPAAPAPVPAITPAAAPLIVKGNVG